MTEQERQDVSEDTQEVYPLVALKNMVVFPRTRMTLAIAREKSVRAVEEAMMRTDRPLITDTQQQQDILQNLEPLERSEKICVIMGNEIEILELESTIRTRVRSQVDRTQKEYYLREQLRAIQEELGMETSSEADELRARLNEKTLPAEAVTRVRKEIDRLERTPSQSAEVAVIRSYIDWMLALPWLERS